MSTSSRSAITQEGYAYDYLGRRIEKKVYTYQSGWVLTEHRKFVWSGTGAGGWLLLLELDGLSEDAVVRKYTWGLDQAGQAGGSTSGRSALESAGGIGGLLAVSDVDDPNDANDPYGDFVYFYDANGNVGQLVDLAHDPNDPTGALAAKYQYDPYGKVIAQSGSYADANPIRWSTKYWDDETGLGYWGYRYYDPRTGRWISRDPMGETGEHLLYGYLANNPVSHIDPLGLQQSDCAGKIDVKPMTLEEVWKQHPKSAEELKSIGIDITDKGLLGQTTLARCVTLPPEKGGGLFCLYEFGYKFKGKCGCGNSIIQQTTKVKTWLKGGATVKEEKSAFVEAFESKDDWSVIIDHHFHGGQIDSKVADQRCVWTKVVFCCGKFGDKGVPSKYEKYGDESDKVNCAGPKSELTINFCYDLKGRVNFDPPEPFRPKATEPSTGSTP